MRALPSVLQDSYPVFLALFLSWSTVHPTPIIVDVLLCGPGRRQEKRIQDISTNMCVPLTKLYHKNLSVCGLHVYAGICMCTCVCKEAKGQLQVSFLRSSWGAVHVYFETSLAGLELVIRLAWLASDLSAPVPSTGITSLHHHTQTFFYRVLGIELRSI